MNWNEYQQSALTTAIYPLKRELEYTILGLCSEAGEIGEAYEAGKQGWGFNKAQTAHLLDESGDVWWYAAAVTDALKLPFSAVGNFSEVMPDFSKSRGITILRIQKHAGNLAGILKKTIRDNDGFVEEVHKQKMLAELYQLTWQLDHLAILFGTTSGAVMAKNLNKLADRKARGVLQGSGDNR